MAAPPPFLEAPPCRPPTPRRLFSEWRPCLPSCLEMALAAVISRLLRSRLSPLASFSVAGTAAGGCLLVGERPTLFPLLRCLSVAAGPPRLEGPATSSSAGGGGAQQAGGPLSLRRLLVGGAWICGAGRRGEAWCAGRSGVGGGVVCRPASRWTSPCPLPPPNPARFRPLVYPHAQVPSVATVEAASAETRGWPPSRWSLRPSPGALRRCLRRRRICGRKGRAGVGWR